MAGGNHRPEPSRSVATQGYSARQRARGGLGRRTPLAARRGFSLLELLIVLGVAWLLIGLLMPSFARLRESARRVGCASNMHQIAIALESFTRDNRNRLPNSFFAGTREREPKPQEMMILNRGEYRDTWDGIGRLFSRNYVDGSGVYYCPSHKGDHTPERYQDRWKKHGRQQIIFGNYQYRGMLNLASQTPDPIDRYDRDQIRNSHPAGLSLLADGLRTKSDFNHVQGCNLLQDDLSVTWFADQSGRIYSILPDMPGQPWPRSQIWLGLDQGVNNE